MVDIDNEKALAGVILTFIGLILGSIFLGEISTFVTGNTDLSSASQESIVISSSTGQTANDDVVVTSFFGNTTFNTTNVNVDLGEEVNVSSVGVVTVTAANFSDATYKIDYTHEGELYVSGSSSARVIIGIIPIFFAIFILLIGVMFLVQSGVFSSFKE